MAKIGLPTIVALVVVGFAIYCQRVTRIVVSDHLANHPAFSQEDLVPEDLAKELQKLIYEMKEYPSNVDQTKATGFIPKYEHVGEAQPVNEHGECDHALLFPNADRTLCILPQRVDIGKHYVLTGGLDGKKENVDDSIDRVSSFGRYTFMKDIDHYPAVKTLFENEKFQNAAKQVCPADKTYLDTFQFNFIIQVPGQTVALHLDAPYFWGASRFDFPQWLLVAMVFSNLFKEQFIDQIQVVAYVHDWGTRGDTKAGVQADGGDFVYFANNTAPVGVVSPVYRSGTFVDGSKVLHAAKIYRPDVKAPKVPKDQSCALRHIEHDDWEVQCDEIDVDNGEIKQRHINGKYKFHDLRISIVYRARCFTDEDEAARYKESAKTDIMDLNNIMKTFKDDMINNKKIRLNRKQLDEMDSLDFAFLIMNTYIKYPLPPKDLALFPYNYCAVPLLAPKLKSLFNLFC